ncbi:MAG: rhodanese-like domain-containing protein [Sphingobacteriia bacterium]|nr:MAG: rhodanese-like domain-containing protein [Sphingobacteriia bacterium]
MQTITVEELNAKIQSGEKINLVDVREPHEHAEFNIGGLLHPLGKIQTMQLDEIEDMKDQPIYVYCRSGNRSGQACLILETAGFTNTINVVGGMLAWQEKIAK